MSSLNHPHRFTGAPQAAKPDPRQDVYPRPYAPSVRALVDAFAEEPYRAVISREAVSQVIGETPGSHRYYAVVRRWKDAMLKQHRVVIRTVAGRGYEVCDASSSLAESRKHMRTIERHADGAWSKANAADADELTQPERSQREHTMLYAAQVASTGAQHRLETRAAKRELKEAQADQAG